jgi:hypothetical protein
MKKIPNIIRHQRNVNLNYNEISFCPSKNGNYQKQNKTNTSKDVVKRYSNTLLVGM